MTTLHPERILLTTDFSDNAAAALPYACALAQHYDSQVIVLHVIHENLEHLDSQVVSPAMDKRLLDAKQKALEKLHQLVVEGTSCDNVTREVVCASSASTGILDAARNHEADCIVMATHGRGVLGQVILGSVANHVLSKAPCPVLCIKAHETGMLDDSHHLRIRSILVAGGLGDESRPAFDTALRWAQEFEATVHYMDLTHPSMTPIFYPEGLITVVETGESRLAAEHRRQQFLKEALQQKVMAVHANTDAVNGNDIARYARAHDVDVVVVQRSTWGNVIAGSDSSLRSLVHDVHSPLLVL
jgi:nucleotide-binding universal stress UspA family protein